MTGDHVTDATTDKRMRLRYGGVCRLCGVDLAAGTQAVYERASKTVRCLECPPAQPMPDLGAVAAAEPEPAALPNPLMTAPQASAPAAPTELGEAGLSARREYERRVAKCGARVRAKHPRLGGLMLALTDDPQSTTAWSTGALGEERLGRGLNERASATVRLLHDRRIPGTRANIDHIAVTATGIFVIDAKRYVGKRPTLRVEGGLFRARTEKLFVGGRDRTKLVGGVLKQVDLVRGIVGDGVPVTGVLCFVESDWPLIGGDFTTRGVMVLWPKRLYPRLAADGPHGDAIESHHRSLASAFPPA